MSIRREIIGLTDILDVVANRLEEITATNITEELEVILQSNVEKIRAVSENLYERAHDRAAVTSEQPKCKRCSGTGKIFECTKWPGCGCSERTREVDCTNGIIPCPDCDRNKGLVAPEEVFQQIGKLRRGDQS